MKWHTKIWACISAVLFSSSTATAAIIEFADQETKRICLENYDSNGDGTLTDDEVKKVVSLNGKFRRADITSFDELKHFTNLRDIEFRPTEGIVNLEDEDIVNRRGDFYNCRKLKSITIPDNVTFIGTKAFWGCSSLKTIEIPAKVTKMGDFVFQGCTNMRMVTTKAPTPPDINETTFPHRASTILVVPKGCLKAYRNADYWKEFMLITDDPVGDKTAYMALSQNNTLATFFYDEKRNERQGRTVSLDNFDGLDAATAAGVEKVVFDLSFSLAKPQSMHRWFYGMSNLSIIEGLSFLDTSDVMDMSMAFYGCASLSSLDISRFDTSKTTDMHSMFYDCSALKHLDLSNFDTSRSVITETLLKNCSSLDSLAISGTMGNLDDNAFQGVGAENTPCAIYYPEGFVFGVGDTDGVFSWKSGWFRIDESSFEAYFVMTEDQKNITFYYDNWMKNRTGYACRLEGYESFYGIWSLFDDMTSVRDVKKVSFMPSFAKARPTTTRGWFELMEDLETIEGMEYLNTSLVTDMGSMFKDCEKLRNIDLSNFDTSNVTMMSSMFLRCTNLQSLDLSGFNTSKVTSSSYMLEDCSNLGKLTISSKMGNLEENTFINLGAKNAPCLIYVPEGFEFGVDTSGSSFQWKSGWFRLANGDSESYLVLSQNGRQATFYYDNLQSGRQGTVIDLDKYEGLGDGTATLVDKVIFTPSFALARPSTTCKWFHGMDKLTSIDGMKYLNTTEVRNMTYMFRGCSKLNDIDLSSFDTSNVTEMSDMFDGCYSLKSLDVSSFNTSNVQNMAEMFERCSSLTVLDVSGFDIKDGANTLSMFGNCSSLQKLCISHSFSRLDDKACEGVGTEEKPCHIIAPKGFDFGTAVNGKFQWKAGWFTLGKTDDVEDDTDISLLDNAIYVKPASALTGSEKTICICLKNKDEVAAYQFSLKLPEGLEMAMNSDGKYMAKLIGDRHDEHGMTVNLVDSTYLFGVLSLSGGELAGNDGEVIELNLQISEDVKEGTYPIRIFNARFSTPHGTALPVKDTKSTITIENYMRGDVNNDKVVDIADAVCIVNHVVRKPNSVFINQAGDMNNDGEIDLADAVSIVNIVVRNASAQPALVFEGEQ